MTLPSHPPLLRLVILDLLEHGIPLFKWERVIPEDLPDVGIQLLLAVVSVYAMGEGLTECLVTFLQSLIQDLPTLPAEGILAHVIWVSQDRLHVVQAPLEAYGLALVEVVLLHLLLGL